MYSTCIFCHARLGSNQALEEFPVGRRLAFDAAKGRLWAVCRACGRWNLSPLETRWEAVEACERSFRDTRVRVSTENIGLARLAEGTELVRIGAPLRPEFAAWRYGDQFGRRRRGLVLGGAAAAALAGVGGVLAASAPLVLVAAPVALAWGAGLAFVARGSGPRTPGGAERSLLDNEGEPVLAGSSRAFWRARIRTGTDFPEGWWLETETARWDQTTNEVVPQEVRRHRLHGGAARQAVSVFVARANAWGGSTGEVRSAVGMLERAGEAERYFTLAEADARKQGWGYQDVWNMPGEVRLALEMAAHEDTERRALEGELAELERQWRAAEEIAAIADSLAVPAEVERRLRRMRSEHP
ncbi:MAG TPA: hypothetical protein VF615_11140 [Longimicrobiaceae bacterium]|jgi:hypothetical protein